MSSVPQFLRDKLVYSSGFIQGRAHTFPNNIADLYGVVVGKITSLVSLPLPFLSFLAVPFFSGTSTTLSLAFFYLTWSAFVLSHNQLAVEFYGTLAVRLLCFVLPALGFAIFDGTAPKLSRGLKNRGTKQLPLAQLERRKLLEITGWAVLNVAGSVLLEVVLEFFATEVLRVRSVFKVTSFVPLPWNIIKNVAAGFVVRGILVYAAHRFLHEYESPLRTWHLQWQHSVSLPFSLVAAYDHPVNYLLVQWLPMFLPAYLSRWHVLTWHLFVALCSLEDLFVYSGYAVLPSNILLLGMARRTDEHFAVVDEGKAAGNFGRWGVMDFVCGTTCQEGDDAADDLHKEAEKHGVKDRAQNAMDGAVAGVKSKQRSKSGNKGQGKSSKG